MFMITLPVASMGGTVVGAGLVALRERSGRKFCDGKAQPHNRDWDKALDGRAGPGLHTSSQHSRFMGRSTALLVRWHPRWGWAAAWNSVLFHSFVSISYTEAVPGLRCTPLLKLVHLASRTPPQWRPGSTSQPGGADARALRQQ